MLLYVGILSVCSLVFMILFSLDTNGKFYKVKLESDSRHGYYDYHDNTVMTLKQVIKMYVNAFFGGLFAGAIASFVIGGMLVGGTYIFAKQEYQHSHNFQLKGMKDNVATTYIMRRNHSSESSDSMRYYYMTKEYDNSLRQRWAPASDSSIFEDIASGNESYVEIYFKKFVHPNNFFVKQTLDFFGTPDYETKWKFHIPEGSVSGEFNVDME